MLSSKTLNSKQVKEIVGGFINLLKKNHVRVKDVYLYGSYAKKKATQNSDIDICVIADTFKNNCDFNVYLNKMVVKLDNKYKSYLSPVGFDSASFKKMVIPLVYEIKQSGEKISY